METEDGWMAVRTSAVEEQVRYTTAIQYLLKFLFVFLSMIFRGQDKCILHFATLIFHLHHNTTKVFVLFVNIYNFAQVTHNIISLYNSMR